MVMCTTTLPLAEVRANPSRTIEEAVRTHQRVEVTRSEVFRLEDVVDEMRNMSRAKR